ncbi:MAG: hypothetical protein ACRCXB_31305 [Aeromonadaceae bacterium]
MTDQVFISGLPVNASVITDEQGATCIRMPTSEVDVRLWARVARSAGFRVVYQYTSGRYRLDCVCVDLDSNYRGIYSKDFCTVWLGKAELFE